MRRIRAALVWALLSLPTRALGYGEPDAEGVPNHRERLLHVLTNQVRQAPHDWPGWDTSKATAEARPPLMIETDLLTAARFHADDMSSHGCFQHESCDGTSFEARLSRYFSGPAGENIYYSLGDDRERSAITGWMNSDGHRRNILTAEWVYLGTGEADSGAQIYYVQDFGMASRVELPVIPGAARELVAGGMMQLLANAYDAGGRPPKSFRALLDGTPVPLSRVAGSMGNSTWAATVVAPTDCAPLYFELEPETGNLASFPSTGSMLVGTRCSSEYTSERKGAAPGPTGPVVIDAVDDTGCRAVHGGGRPSRASVLLGWAALGVLFARSRRRRRAVP